MSAVVVVVFYCWVDRAGVRGRIPGIAANIFGHGCGHDGEPLPFLSIIVEDPCCYSTMLG